MTITMTNPRMALLLIIALMTMLSACKSELPKPEPYVDETKSIAQEPAEYPHDVIPFMDQFKILMGDGTREKKLVDYKYDDFFYTATEGGTDWVVYKTPNKGTTSPNSSNTRTELHQTAEWVPMTGGRLTGTLKVMHVSTTGDARVAASYSTVVGQIHGGDGHENEPIKIYYKKFPGQDKGSVFWNYEINTTGTTKEDNKGRWDFSYPVWGYDFSIVGAAPDSYPAEPADGIKLGEEFSYEINVYQGIMYVTFSSPGHETKTFTKSLIETEYATKADIPEQVVRLFGPLGQDGIEKPKAYTGSHMYFKQGVYNQTNGKEPETNMVWSTGADVYGGVIAEQYAHGSYSEVWFKEGTVGPGVAPGK